MTSPPKLRCAIYTRKSSEEGLEQGFNSLHAQREACEAYIQSQAGEGWTLLKTAYDDGGFSGGSMDRPGLKTLLLDIEVGQIDIVVVYKVDRLTRSLTDFAKIVDIFESSGTSFVSVTQAFNTTTSMGRLTLNVLLSFAQFEREVTGERIRDKFAASKKKGMWMGGRPPLGYDIHDRKLIANKKEARAVRQIYERYLELGSVTLLSKELKDRGIRSKSWVTQKGEQRVGGWFGRGALYALLKNPIYRGQVSHKGKIYEGEHRAILNQELWERVQKILETNRRREVGNPFKGSGSLLAGLLFDDEGNSMSPTHAKKKNGKRYRYYISQALIRGQANEAGSVARVPAQAIEGLVIDQVRGLEKNNSWDELTPKEQAEIVWSTITRVEIHSQEAVIEWRREASLLGVNGNTHRIPIELKRRGKDRVIVRPDNESPDPRLDRALIKALVFAHTCREAMESGKAKSTNDLAKLTGNSERYVRNVRNLAFLAPGITDAILRGEQPQLLTLAHLIRSDIPLSWAEQPLKLGVYEKQSS
jgi:DNA invertase Pin-like site-specific DNA recombinase